MGLIFYFTEQNLNNVMVCYLMGVEHNPMSKNITQGEDDRELEGKAFRYIPKTTIGKILLGIYTIAFIAIGLSVTGFVFADPVLVAGMPATAVWTYAWYTVIFGVIVGTYVFLFGPWADSAEWYRKEELVNYNQDEEDQ